MQKIWIDSYADGIPAEIVPDARFQSLLDLFHETCQKFGDNPAYANFGSVLTYQEVKRQAKIFAAYLQKKFHVSKGDRVGIMLPNLLQFPVALFGILLAGGIVVNINPLYTATELSHQLKDSGCESIVILENFAHVLEKALPETSVKNIVVTQVGDSLSGFKKKLINFVVKFVQRKVPSYFLPHAISYPDIFSQVKADDFKSPPIGPDDVAFLQYTGGTTGIAKGAMLTHANMMSNLLQIKAWSKNFVDQKAEVMITALPLYHIFSLAVSFLNFFVCGGLSVLITNPRDMDGFIKTLKKYPFTVITGVNTLFNALLNQPKFSTVDFSHLHVTLGGGMAVQKTVAEKWEKITGKPLSEGYGLTEASPVVTINPLGLKEFTGSIGLPVPSTDITIRDEHGDEVKLGEIGELWVKGPQVMKGYWNNFTETQKVITPEGWLKTGDLVKMDEKGFIYIVDRKKDMILVSGFNVYPNEVESVIAMMPGVLEVGVVGELSGMTGELVKAVIVKKDPKLTEEDVIHHCRIFLTGYKVPKQIEFRDVLPKNNVGKILRRELKSF